MIYIILCRRIYAKSMKNVFKDAFTLDLQTLFDDSCGTGNNAYILCAAGKTHDAHSPTVTGLLYRLLYSHI